MEKVNIELTVEEVNGILTVLAELPTKTNAWPLFSKIQEQVKAQAQPNSSTQKPESAEAEDS